MRGGEVAGLVAGREAPVLEAEYQRLKSQLLRSGTAGELPVRRIVAQLDLCSDMRRLAEQAEKGALYLDGLRVFSSASHAETA